MKIDRVRISRYLTEIQKSASELKNLVTGNRLSAESIELKAAKYMLMKSKIF